MNQFLCLQAPSTPPLGCPFSHIMSALLGSDLPVCSADSFPKASPAAPAGVSTVCHRSLIHSLSTCRLSVHLQDCKQEAALSAKARGRRAERCSLLGSSVCYEPKALNPHRLETTSRQRRPGEGEYKDCDG